MSFQITLSGNRKAAARFVGTVRRRLLRALEESPEVTQTEIARKLGVHRSVITRQLKGTSDLTLGRVAEIAWALGYRPSFDLTTSPPLEGSNHANAQVGAPKVQISTATATVVRIPDKQLEVV